MRIPISLRRLDLIVLGGSVALAVLFPKPLWAQKWTARADFPSTDGIVKAIVIDSPSHVAYIGGDFTTVGGQPRDHLAAVDTRTGAVLGWNPSTNGDVEALAIDGGTIYAAGDFTAPRSHLAAIDSTTGAVTSWNPDANDIVYSLSVGGNGIVYAGGIFSKIGALSRSNFAAIDTATGVATAFAPDPNGAVYALVSSGGILYLGGDFTLLNGGATVRHYLAAMDQATQTINSWDPNATNDPAASSEINTLAADSNTIFAGGNFNALGGVARSNLAAIDKVTGQVKSWNPNTDGEVYTLALGEGTVCIGGAFTTVAGASRRGFAEVDATTGLSKTPDAGFDNTVTSLALSEDTVFAGGFFLEIGGASKAGFAALDFSTQSMPVPRPESKSLKITSLKKATTVTRKSRITLRGVAAFFPSDVFLVQIKVGHSSYQVANGTSEWRFKTDLQVGKNKIIVRATDSTGKNVITAKATIIRR